MSDLVRAPHSSGITQLYVTMTVFLGCLIYCTDILNWLTNATRFSLPNVCLPKTTHDILVLVDINEVRVQIPLNPQIYVV